MDTSGSDEWCPHGLSAWEGDCVTVTYPGKNLVPEKRHKTNKKTQESLLPLLPFRMQELTMECRISILCYRAYLAVQARISVSWESLQSWCSVSQDSAAFLAVAFLIKLKTKAYPPFSASGH